MKKNLYHVVFNLVALSILIYIGVDIFYRTICFRLTEISSVEIAEVRTPSIAHYVPQPLNSFDVIVDRNLFGSSHEATSDVKPMDMETEEIEALEPTALKISLLGTVTGSEENARAVIEETGRKTQGLYRVGDSVQNAVVRKILWGKVVLRVGDKDEILSMEVPESKKGGRTSSSVKPVHSGDTLTVARSDIQDSLKNINKLLTQARIRPHLKDGKPDGFALSYIKANSFFTKLGLRRGDIVKRINGKQINTPEDAFSFYQALESGAPLSMEISRGGKPKTINYRFK
ncbi:MAG TPA: hypothetical protein HPP41_02850 [Deltaproteobacteria bacterium]|nr:hypothetical protein [Deltaproteobacteria bacterium]